MQNQQTQSAPARTQLAYLLAMIAAAVAFSASIGQAQHIDIAVYQSQDRVTLHNSSVASQPERRTYRNDFDFWGPPLGIYVGDNPGFQMSGTNSAPNGYLGLPAGEELLLSSVPVHVPGQSLGNLLFWDGSGTEPELSPLPAGHEFFLEDAASNERTLLGDATRIDDLVAGVTDGVGGLHEHLTFALENGGDAPASGFYVMGWQLTSGDLASSQVAYVTLTTPTIPSTVKSSFVDWLDTQIGTVTMAGDFDDNGQYETADIDALIGSVAAGNNEVEFDLTLDGIVNLEDVDLWRAIAGAVLNESGAPILPGDANLDGDVNGVDFVAWNNAKFTSTGTWSNGDFNADGETNGVDFVVWNTNKFMTADSGTQPVPEPACCIFGLIAASLLLTRRNK
jgi:hypothetical protein